MQKPSFNDDDLPPLVLYKGEDLQKSYEPPIKEPASKKSLLSSAQTSQPSTSKPIQPLQSTTIPKITPVRAVNDHRPTVNPTSQESRQHTPRRLSRGNNGTQDEEDHKPQIEIQRKNTQEKSQSSPMSPQKMMTIKDDDTSKQYDSQKIIEQYLRNMGPNLVYAEIENLSDAMIEKQIQRLDGDMNQESSKIKALRSEQKALAKNDIRIKYIEQEIALVSDKLLLMDRVKNLFRDKITLRTQIFNQKTLINQLAQRIVRMDTEFTVQIHQLKTYNATLPTEREQALELKLKALEKQFDQEKKLRENLENAVAVNIGAFQSLFTEAQEAKGHIADQLRIIKQKKDDLEHRSKQFEEHQAQVAKHQVQPGIGKQAGGSFAQAQSNQSSNSSKQNIAEPKAGPVLSKIIQRNVQQQQQQESSFSRVGSSNKEQSVLQGLNTTSDRQGQPLNDKGKASLGIIKENDVSLPHSMDDPAFGDSAIRMNNMVKNIRNMPQKNQFSKET